MTDIIYSLSWAYCGGWLLFIKPILQLITAYEAGTVTTVLIVFAIIKLTISGIGGNILCRDLQKQIEGV